MRDATSRAAIGKIAGEQLIIAMERLEIKQRALVFAFFGMEIPLPALARELKMTVSDARQQIKEGLATLQADELLLTLLSGVSRAGDRANFQEHIRRLGLETWFCRQCHGFQVQKGRGRPRITCSDRCRRELHARATPNSNR